VTRTSISPIRTCALVLATACAAALASGTATAGSIVYAKDNAVRWRARRAATR
jgi:hypothetical protein